MIALTVYSFNGAPSQGPSAVFDELGGTIGRADTNQLVLPDPNRDVSRLHARVVFRGLAGYVIIDSGSNPISVNGVPVGSGREHPLAPGDELQIGGYCLRAGDVATAAGTDAADADPFAGLLDDPFHGLAQPRHAPPVQRSVTQTWTPQPPAGAAPAALSPGVIPDDWDPFADPSPASAPASGFALAPGMPASAPASGDFDASGLGHAPASESLDDLFGLAATPQGGDPLGLLPPRAQPSSDRVGSELNTPMPRVAVVAPPPPPTEAAAARPVAPSVAAPVAAPVSEAAGLPETAAAGMPEGAVFSWGSALPPAAAAAQIAANATPPAARSPRVSDAAQDSHQAMPVPAQAASGSEAALLAALLQGLDAPGLKLEALTPQAMQLIGQLLHASTEGAVDLLLARAAFKRELRAEQTLIVARGNNPLKFSPSAPVALQHLLGRPTPGFMAPASAVRDAFDDLKAHQLAVMAGMKAALEGVLRRFNPEQLEAQLAARSSGLMGLIPGSRKARLWELFQELFGQLEREAQDDFDQLFGRAFVQAYEAQLDLLASSRSGAVAHDKPEHKE
jgi:type VI secretion system FHA domain protein